MSKQIVAIILALIFAFLPIKVGEGDSDGFISLPQGFILRNNESMRRIEHVYKYQSLPEALSIPIYHNYYQKINPNLSEFRFNIIGEKKQEYKIWEYKYDANNPKKYEPPIYYLKDPINYITQLKITNDDLGLNQVIELETETMCDLSEDYGLFLEDYNFDGYLDIKLFKEENNAHFFYDFWVWDKTSKKYVESVQLEDLINGSYNDKIVDDTINVTAKGTLALDEYYYKYINKEYVLVKMIDRAAEVENPDDIPYSEDDGWFDSETQKYYRHRMITYQLINGKMLVVNDEKW
ncbi:MAG: hypothetical protein LBM38_01670 [Clostridiales bacterium]|jgi:hypothetical protein|nr:hypothetical protein [Clostridiales bacterium]